MAIDEKQCEEMIAAAKENQTKLKQAAYRQTRSNPRKER
jgi:hypothetical protein